MDAHGKHFFAERLKIKIKTNFTQKVTITRRKSKSKVSRIRKYGELLFGFQRSKRHFFSKIKALIMDMDGTLIISQHFHADALIKTFKEYGITYSREEDQKKYSGKRSKVTCEAVFKENGKNPTEEEVTACANQKKKYYDEIIAEAEIPQVPGIIELLKKAETKKLPIAIASGNKQDAAKKLLERSQIGDHWFKKIVTQEQVKNTKPAPDLFLLAAKELSVEPQNCIVFEDALNGVKAAKAANMFCVAVTTGESKEALQQAGADIVVQDYHELLEKFPTLLS
ncbi:HAD family phosphatase [Candidatus Peregrinibacteria bacterium]|nr:HAD family phosphatase [Candidatus Peregrinibacteria bacterium]